MKPSGLIALLLVAAFILLPFKSAPETRPEPPQSVCGDSAVQSESEPAPQDGTETESENDTVKIIAVVVVVIIVLFFISCISDTGTQTQ